MVTRGRGRGCGHRAARIASGDGLLLRGLQPGAPLPNDLDSIRLTNTRHDLVMNFQTTYNLAEDAGLSEAPLIMRHNL